MSNLKRQASMQTHYELSERLKNIITLYSEFRQLQDGIEGECGAELIDAQYELRNQVEDYYYLSVSTIQSEIDKIKLAQQPPVNPLNHNNNSSDIKLPRIDIPVFSGDYKCWPEFKDLFESLIHDNNSLKNVQKFHYLKNKLSGEAANLIKSLHMTDANYTEAWKRINDRYQHKRFIVESHLNTLFNQKSIQHEDASAIKQLIDNSTEVIRALQVIGLQVNSWDAILVHIISSKLDKETHKQWELTLKKEELPTFKSLEDFLEVRWQSLEMIDKSKAQNSSEAQHSASFKQFNSRNYQKPQQSTNSSQQATNSNPVKSNPCIYCNKSGHMTGFCPEYVSLSHDGKTNFVKSKKLCFNCLRPNHSLASCTNKANCVHCGKRHHSSLHVMSKVQIREPINQSNPVNQQSQPSQPHKAHAVNSSTQNGIQVLLATAIVNVTTASGLKIPARALIDKGGDHSIIQEKFARKLGLMHQKESTPIIGVGEIVAQAETHLVKIEIESFTDPEFKLEVETYTMKTITGNLPNIPIERKKWPHLSGIKLADNQFESSASIQLLLGAEVYEEILLEGIIKKQENSPTAINSRLGWLLFGKVQAKLPSRSGLQIHHTSAKKDSLEAALRSFWELEEEQKFKMIYSTFLFDGESTP